MAIYRGIGSASSTSDQATIDAVTTKATEAATSATNAASSATAAASSATSAASSATTATSQATNAASSATSAASSATSAASSYDSFDDRYLGSKLSDPSVDNDGDALLTGALYFNSSSGEMRVYDGSSWVAAYASLGGALIASNNLSDLASASTARTNLGLGTAATTASTDYATAAQGALADSALQSFTETNDLTAAVTWDNVPDANITQTSVTQHQAALSITESQISDFGTYEPADATILKDADIGVTVQAYDATIVVDADIANMLETTDIGVSVQAYDVDTLKADTADTITAPMRGTVTPDNDLSFDMNVTNNFKCTPTGNGTLTFTNITAGAGQSGNIWLDNSGGHTISAASSTYIASADLTTISTAGVYFLSYYSDGTNVMVSATPAVTSAGA